MVRTDIYCYYSYHFTMKLDLVKSKVVYNMYCRLFLLSKILHFNLIKEYI